MKNEKIERREFKIRELRVVEDGQPVIEGYAAVFNQKTDMYYFTEMIEQGAFSESIHDDDIRALVNHDSNYVLGRNTAKTLELSEDEHGLKVQITPPDTQWARDLIVSMKRGDIDQMSFMFDVLSDEWKKEDGIQLRTIQKAKLYDVSVVTFPAYPQTVAHARDIFTAYQAAAESLSQKDKDSKEATKPEDTGVATTEIIQDSDKAKRQQELLRMDLELKRKRLDILSSSNS